MTRRAGGGERLRVAVDATPLLGPRTGVAMFVEHLLDRLASDPAIDLHPWIASFRGRNRYQPPPGTQAMRLPMAARPLHLAWKHADLPPLEWWTGPIDVAHGTNFVLPPTNGAAGLLTIHDLTPWRFPHLANRYTLAYPALVERARRRGVWVHTDSESVRREVIEDLGFPADRVVTVHLGIPDVPEADALDGARLAGGTPYVLALGTVEPRKNLPSLVRAFDTLANELPDLRLVIAGPDGWGAEQLKDAIHGAAHGDRIVRLGSVTDAQRGALLRGAHVLAYPSIYEGFGFPPIEAMSVGVPVVTTSSGSLPEVVGDAALVVDPNDDAALVGALGRAVSDNALREEMRERGCRQARRFGWDACVDELVGLYRRMVEMPAPKAGS